MHYRLTCNCGTTHLVTTSQAGQKLVCTCGNPLPIPTLRELKQLPHAQPAGEQPKRAIDQPDTRRPSLLIGLMFAIIALGIPTAIFFTYQRLTVDTSYTEAWDREEAFAALDAATPGELSATWEEYSTHGLGLPTKPVFYQVQLYTRGLEWKAGIAWGVVLLAAIVAGSVSAMRRERQRSSTATR